MSKREYTVTELMMELAKMPNDAKVVLLDADTDWVITKFSLSLDENEVCFYPSDYSEMRK